MSITDAFGAPLSCDNAVLVGVNDFVEGFVQYQPRAVNVMAFADSHPDSAIAAIYTGMLWLFSETPEAVGKALPFVQQAQQCTGLNEREKGLLALLGAWQRYDFTRVLRIAEQLIDTYPQDLSTLKIAQYHFFNRADAKGMLRVAKKGLVANVHHAAMHSMVAFGHEQLHDLEQARAAANNALNIDAAEPWAHHALAHIHLGLGETAEGKAFMHEMSSSWQGLNSFMLTHNWWHYALFLIAEGEADQAVQVYDKHCWAVQPDYSQDQIGAVSLLARLEIAGVDVGERWQALEPYLVSREHDVIQPFLSLQYLYGLARVNAEQADALLALIHQQAVQPVVTQDQALWAEVGVSAAEGVYAHAKGEYDVAVDKLSSVRRGLWQVGGSHAQRDVFEQWYLDALLRAERWPTAHQLLQQRLKWEPRNPLLHAKLHQVQTHLSSG